MPTVVSTSGESGKEGEPPVVAGSPHYHTIDSLLHVIHDAITDEADQLDVSYDGEGFREFTSERVETENTHGTGCTFASAIAAGLAKRMGLGGYGGVGEGVRDAGAAAFLRGWRGTRAVEPFLGQGVGRAPTRDAPTVRRGGWGWIPACAGTSDGGLGRV